MTTVTGGIAQVNQGFRTTAAGVTLGRALFDPHFQVNLSPAMVSNLLRAAGVPIPKGVDVAVATGQAIMAGGALVDGIEAGVSIGADIAGSINLIGDVLNVFELCGLVDPNSPPAKACNFIGALALVIACGGVNVLADLALVLDIISTIFSEQAKVEAEHKQIDQAALGRAATLARNINRDAFKNWYANKTGLEATTAAVQFGDYHTGKISVFQMMGNVAEQSPDLFTNYFPNLKSFFPPVIVSSPQFSATASYIGAKDPQFGDMANNNQALLNDPIFQMIMGVSYVKKMTYTDTTDFDYYSIQNDHATVQQALFKYFYQMPIEPYRILSSMTQDQLRQYGFPSGSEKLGLKPHANPVRRMSVEDMAILSLFPPYFTQMSPDLDVSVFLMNLGLTPKDFDSSLIEDEMSIGRDFGNKPVARQAPAITMNGVDYFTPSETAYNRARDAYDLATARAVQYDQASQATPLLMIPRVNTIVKEWGIMPDVPPGTLPPDSGYVLSQGSSYRDVRNLIAAYSMYATLSNDPYFTNAALDPGALGLYSNLEDKHKKLQFLSVGRKMNAKARLNIARYMGVPVSKLKMAPAVKGQLAKAV